MVYKYGPAKKALRLTAALLFLCVLLSFVCVAAEPDYITHTVVSGDTLGKIAKLYGVTVSEIAELNNITDVNIISVGDELKIPVIAPETTAAEETTALETATETAAPEPPAELTYDTSYITMFEDMSTVISVNFNQTDIRDVLSAFAVNLGCNFIFKGAATSVTLALNDVTVGEALDYVMKLINMTYITDGRTIIVGEKQDLIKSFSEAVQLTEFILSYVPASTIMSQITALGIQVTTSLSGENEYRFIAQGLPTDLSKVRDLISMIDRVENSKLGPITVTSFFNKIELKYITAVDLQSVLASTSLPTGIVLPAKPRTLYVYASAEDYKLIMSICKVVDTSNPAVTVVDPEQTVIKQINLRYVTLELIESQITANAEVSIIKIATNKSSFWLNGKLAQIKKAEEIVRLLDTEKNAAATSQEIKDLFRPVTLKFITAEQFNTILTGLSLPNGLIFPDNAKTMFMYASADEFKTITEIQAVVDKAANNSGTASIFRAVTLRYITADQFNTTLTGLSLPAGIIFPNNEKTLFIFATPEQFDAINDMQKVVDVPTNAADMETQFITLVLRYITAEQFNTTLAALNLPTGIIYSDNENTLYINATYEEQDNINKIKAIVDVPQNKLTVGDKFRYITLRYMTADQFNETLKSMSLPTGLTFPNNIYMLYIYSTASEYNAINDIRIMVDIPQNTLSSEETERVTLMIDSADGTGGEAKLKNRISIISLMSGISQEKFAVSSNISKTDAPKFILYLNGATLAEIKRAREIVTELGSGSGGTSVDPVGEAVAAFNMITVGTAEDSYTIPIYTDDSDIFVVSGGYQIAETETTYELWYAVKKWALANGYYFQSVGPEGTAGREGVGREGNDGGIGLAPTTGKLEPVTDISWRDAVVWLNALSELKGLIAVYYNTVDEIIRDSRDSNATVFDNVIQKNNNGYRLPSSMEWEMAARWIDSTNWTPSSYASGAGAVYYDESATGAVAWYASNSNYTTNFVKLKAPNSLKLYDMSGNVWEWCFDFDYGGSGRVIRGGSWNGNSSDMQVGYSDTFDSSHTSIDIGFRIAKKP